MPVTCQTRVDILLLPTNWLKVPGRWCTRSDLGIAGLQQGYHDSSQEVHPSWPTEPCWDEECERPWRVLFCSHVRAWRNSTKVTDRSGYFPRQCPVSAHAIASQLVKNGKSDDNTKIITTHIQKSKWSSEDIYINSKIFLAKFTCRGSCRHPASCTKNSSRNRLYLRSSYSMQVHRCSYGAMWQKYARLFWWFL